MSIKAASRYAKSLIDLATEQQVLEQIKNDMVLFGQVVDDNRELEAILKNPIVPLDKKAGIIQGLFGKQIHDISARYFQLVVSKGRSSILFEISKQFVKQYQVIKGIVTAEVTSATSLSAEAKASIEAIVKREMQANVVLFKEKVDPKLIGGLILKVGDRQFDASIAGGFNKLKKEFAQGIA